MKVLKTKRQKENESAAEYLQEELEERLKCLDGKPDALSQAYQLAIEALKPKKKCYIVSVEVRDAQAYFEPAYNEDDEDGNFDSDDTDDEDCWQDIEGYMEYTRIEAYSMKEAKEKLREKYPEYSINNFNIEEFLLPEYRTDEDEDEI